MYLDVLPLGGVVLLHELRAVELVWLTAAGAARVSVETVLAEDDVDGGWRRALQRHRVALAAVHWVLNLCDITRTTLFLSICACRSDI